MHRLVTGPAARLALVALLAFGAGCVSEKPFTCIVDQNCTSTPGDRCIASSCASRDPGCPTGFRFTRSAGPSAMQCVGSLPDGGLPCSNAGDACDDGDPCTHDDVCVDASTCKGTPMTCGSTTCTAGVQHAPVCMNGQCVMMDKKCDPFGCAGTSCGTRCTSLADCAAGFYCAAPTCLSCGDYLSNQNFVPLFDKPTPVPGNVNQPGSIDDAGALSPDLLSLYFSSDRPGGAGKLDIYQAKRMVADAKTSFMAPSTINSVNSSFNDTDPFTPDAQSLYLASDRGGDFDLYVSLATAGSFGSPGQVAGGSVGNPINQSGSNETHPSATGDNLRLYFDSDRLGLNQAVGDRQEAIFFSTRPAAANQFGGPAQVSMLDSTASWSSPSVTKKGDGMVMVNVAIPSRPEVGVVHLDPSGNATGNTTLILKDNVGMPLLDLGAGAKVQTSSDGCFLLVTDKKDDQGDVYWAPRNGLQSCANAGCGISDHCCPFGCNGLVDTDCAYPRTYQVITYYSQNDRNHDYLLVGEKPFSSDYKPDGTSFRVFADSLVGSVQLNRYTTTSCYSGKRYTYVGTDPGPGHTQCAPGVTNNSTCYLLEQKLGFVFNSIGNGTTKILRALQENSGTKVCDQQLTLSQSACNNLTQSGYACAPIAFGVAP